MRIAASVLVVIFLPAATVLAQTPSIVEHPEVAAEIQAFEIWVEYQIASKSWPGLSVGIVHDQELIYARGFGYANVERQIPAAADTRYQIASNTKLFTAISTLMLRDAGKLELDDPVSKYLSDFAKIDELNQEQYPGAPPITIFNLLTHTSGLPREAPGTDWTNARFPPPDEINAEVAAQTSVLPPGSRWKYSNFAVTEEGEMIAAVAGMPYKKFVESKILQPLGMNNTGFAVPDQENGKAATGYGPLRGGTRIIWPPVEINGLASAGGLWSSVVILLGLPHGSSGSLMTMRVSARF